MEWASQPHTTHPTPLPFEIQVQGHEPREEWQCGPVPEQTGSHRTGLQSSSPPRAPSCSSPPRLERAYESQAADSQRTDRSPVSLSSAVDRVPA